MSVNGEITSVRISRKSSLQTEGDHYDLRDEFDEVSRSRFEDEGRARPRNFDGSHLQPSRGKSSKRDDHILRPDSDEINLEKLLHSVLDISEQGKKHWQANGKTFGKKQRPFSAHQLSSSKQQAHSINGDETRSYDGRSPRIRQQRPISAQVISENRNNYSFSNDNVDRIDRENQRLLREIMRNQAKKSSSRQSVSRKVEPVKVKSAATVNRSRFQSQVERENLAFLKRLEKVKPTKGLSRDHLLKEHCRQEQLSTNISRSKRPPSATQRSRKSSSLSDLSQIDRESGATTRGPVSSIRRPVSSRPTSAKIYSKPKQVLDTRPMWEAGW